MNVKFAMFISTIDGVEVDIGTLVVGVGPANLSLDLKFRSFHDSLSLCFRACTPKMVFLDFSNIPVLCALLSRFLMTTSLCPIQ